MEKILGREPWEWFTICSNNYNGKPGMEYLPRVEFDSIIYYDKTGKHQCDFKVRYEEDINAIVVYFQQTASKSDWKTNFDFMSKYFDAFTYDNKVIQLRAHRGWSNMFLSCKDVIRGEVKALMNEHPDSPICVVGWSLGSGIAALCVEDLHFKFNVQPICITFGSVKPFRGRKTKEYIKSCYSEAYNFYDHCDIVGYMVPGNFTLNHTKVKLEKFCITKLFRPRKFHTDYDTPELYKNIKEGK